MLLRDRSHSVAASWHPQAMNAYIGAFVLSAWLPVSTEAIGFWAAVLTTVAFAPQVIHAWRTGGEGLTWGMLTLFGSGVGLWILYGYLRTSVPLITANSLTGVQVLILLGLKTRHTLRDHKVRERPVLRACPRPALHSLGDFDRQA